MAHETFRNTLDLWIRLQDTTTGMSAGERNVAFFFNGESILPRSKTSGDFVLVNHGRENGLMRVEVFGYEPYEVYIDYEKLDKLMPAVDVFLIPSENAFFGQEFLTLSGRLEGMSFVEAINLSRPLSTTREYDPKHRTMTVYMPNRRMNMAHTHYGIANPSKSEFEAIEIVKELTSQKILLKEPLQEEFVPKSPIYRIVFGTVQPDGSYLLRVRDDGASQKHLVRYQVGDEIRCKAVDFHQLEGVALD
ncbi:MAG: hypothetical protein IJV04_07635 [Lachnospiraceae bacterium]|nr:hypothetical protein [Lachnospiraceae bacterium]